MIQLPEEIVELIISFYDPLWEKKRIRKEINILCFKILQLRKEERYANLKKYEERSITHYDMRNTIFNTITDAQQMRYRQIMPNDHIWNIQRPMTRRRFADIYTTNGQAFEVKTGRRFADNTTNGQAFEVKSNNDGTWKITHGNDVVNIKSN